MPSVKQQQQILEDSEALKGVAEAYTEISALKLQKIRSSIEANRGFFQEIAEVYHVINVEAFKHHTFKTPKKGTVSILLTSNSHFYGALERNLVKFFIVNTTKFQTDRIAIGITAKEMLQAFSYFHPYSHLVFQHDLPSAAEIRSLVATILNYEQIMVYYSRMHSVIIQEPHVVDIVQKPPEQYIQSSAKKVDYIFEPEIELMMNFFESQVTLLLMEQTFLESELARAAARLTAMDQAQLKADEAISVQKRELLSAKRSFDNIKLLETIATMRGREG
jgi:ATP synthase F1 gamma subunit